MRQLLAILGDAFRQSIDRKILLVLLILALLPILMCFSISFESQPIEARIKSMAGEINHFRFQGGMVGMSATHGVDFTVGEVRRVEEGQGWPDDVRGGYTFDLTFPRIQSVDELVHGWGDFKGRMESGGGPPRPPRKEADEKPGKLLTSAERIEFFEDRFRYMGFHRVHALAGAAAFEPAGATAGATLGAGSARFRVALAVKDPLEIPGAHKIHMLFGLVAAPLEEVSVAELVLQIELGLSEIFAGFVVMLIAISTASGFVPDMLQKGTLDLVLARPIGRARLLLFKYLGGLWFIGMFAGFLISGCWAGLALRTGVTSAWFLFSIVPLLATFAVLYSVSVLVGVLTRSASISTLAALGVWGASSIVVGLRHSLDRLFLGAEVPQALKTSLEISYTILPKTKDLGLLNTYILARAQLSSEAFGRQVVQSIPEVDWALSMGTTALFTAAMLALAVWIFRRRDY